MSTAGQRNGGWHWFVLTALVAGAAGFFGGRWTAPGEKRIGIVQGEKSPNAEPKVRSVTPQKIISPDSAVAPIGGAPGHSENQWKDFAALLEHLALTQPAQAMQRALAEPNLSLRAQLRCAVLRGWAATDPSAAAEWTLGRPETERDGLFEALMAGASARPAVAAQIATQFSTRDPDRAVAYGQAAIKELCAVGAFDTAVRFVNESPASPQRMEEMNNAFASWGAHDPDRAMNSVSEITDPALREEAFRGMAIGWAEADPAALARYAVGLAPGDRRAQALANALPRWLEADPVAATQWVQERGTDPHPDFDPVVLALTTNEAVTAHRPELAMSLAEGIADPLLRTNQLRTLALKWAESDAGAARHYIENSRQFTAEERASLLAEVPTAIK